MYINKKIINTLFIIFIFNICIIFGFILNEIFFSDINIKLNEGHYEECVYVTPNGNCYHSQSCSYITEKQPIGLNQALNNGYQACNHCNGVSFNYIWINGSVTLLEQNNYFASFSISSCICMITIYIFRKCSNKSWFVEKFVSVKAYFFVYKKSYPIE